MMVGTIRGAAVVLGLLLSLGAAPAMACEGTECPAAGKPLDLKKFLREQAASTRTPEAMQATRGKTSHRGHAARSGGTHGKSAHAHYPRHKTLAATQDPQPPEAARDAALAYASQRGAQDDPNVKVVSADEINDIDRAAGPAPAETIGSAPAVVQDALATAQDVQVVVQNDFNELDRKAAELTRPAAAVAVTASEVTPHNPPATTWMQWLWSAIGAGFVVLAGVARYLFA